MSAKTPRVALRFDAGHTIGMGHLVRCVNLSRECAACEFVVNDDAVPAMLARGVSRSSLHIASPNWWLDVPGLTHVIVDLNFGGGAPAAAKEVANLRAFGLHVTVIDSLVPDHFVTKTGSIQPNLLVSPYANARGLRPPPETEDWIVGAEYVIFGPELIEAQTQAPRPLGDRILVTCGGSDPSGLSQVILDALAEVDLPVDLVIGPLFAKNLAEELRHTASQFDNIQVHRAPSTLVPLIENAGLVVGRPGLTRYEAAALGRPGLFLVEGDSYRDYFKAFDASGLGRMCFDSDPGGKDLFVRLLSSLSTEDGRRELFRVNHTGLASVDGLGAQRIIEHLFSDR